MPSYPWLLAAWLLITWFASRWGVAEPVASEVTAESQIEQAAVLFVEAYNQRHVEGVSKLFAEDAELVKRSGKIFEGNEEIAESRA